MEVRALVKVPIGVDPHKTSVTVVEDPSEAPRKPSGAILARLATPRRRAQGGR